MPEMPAPEEAPRRRQDMAKAEAFLEREIRSRNEAGHIEIFISRLGPGERIGSRGVFEAIGESILAFHYFFKMPILSR